MSHESDGDSPRIIAENDVMRRLAPYLETLGEVTHVAVDRYLAEIAPKFSRTWPTPRANVIHALLVEEMERHFPERVSYSARRWLWRPTDDLTVQMKKLGPKGLPLNFKTATSVRFAAQLDLPDVPKGMRITLGYVLDRKTGKCSQTRIVAQQGDLMLFSRELPRSMNVAALPAVKVKNDKKALRLKPKAGPGGKPPTGRGKKAGGDGGVGTP